MVYDAKLDDLYLEISEEGMPAATDTFTTGILKCNELKDIPSPKTSKEGASPYGRGVFFGKRDTGRSLTLGKKSSTRVRMSILGGTPLKPQESSVFQGSPPREKEV